MTRKKRTAAAEDETTERAAAESAASGKAEESQDAPPAEYDATARQRIPVLLPSEGGPLAVTFIYDPQAPGPHGTFDRALKEYVRRLSAVPVTTTAEEEAEAHALAQLDAAGWLFDSFIVDVEGVGAEGEQKPADWKNYFTPQEKNRVVLGAILEATPLDDGGNPAGARSWSALAISSLRLRVPFDGWQIDTRHSLKKADGKTLRDFGALLERLNQSGASVMFELAAIYDRLKVSAGGYKGGIVPVHHRAFAALGHLSTQARVTKKN
jgi:hypothetical protein